MVISLAGMAEENSDIKESLNVYNECKQLKNTKEVTYVRNYEANDFGKWQIYDENIDGYWISEINLIYHNEKIRIISYFTTDPGGDTALYLDYFFRIDGTTAYIEEDYRILAGYNTKTVSKIYLSPTGKIVSRNIAMYDLHTEQEVKGEENPEYKIPKIFKNTNELLKAYKVPFKKP